MAVMFKTPDILDDITRTTHYNEDNEYQEETLDVPTNEVKLIKELDRMVSGGIPLSQTQLMRRTGLTGGTLRHYDYIFNDMIEMLGLFYPVEGTSKVKESPKYQEAKELLDKHEIHDFDTLQNKVLEEIIAIALTAGMGNDKYAAFVDDLYNSGIVNKTFNDKAYTPTEAVCSFLGQRYIHPDFVSLDINEMGKRVYEKYLTVQELKVEYDRLKAEV